MEIDIAAEAKDKKLNQMVAITVVVLSIFMGLSQVKDGNIVQAMQQAQSDSVDRWNEYQATKTKLHIDEVALSQSQILSAGRVESRQAAQLKAEQDRLTAEIAKYRAEAPRLAKEAQGFSEQYDALNVHDDQFDASDAFISIAVSIAAVAALADSNAALIASWVFGACGMVMGLAGFLGWGLHLDVLARLLS